MARKLLRLMASGWPERSKISPRDGGSSRRLMRFSSASVAKRWVSITWSW